MQDPAIRSELRSVLSAAINDLPAAYRIVFCLHDVEGLSNPVIAETLQIKLGTIKSRVASRWPLSTRSGPKAQGLGGRFPPRPCVFPGPS